MANFATHFKAAVVVSAAASSVILATNLADMSDILLLFILGALAGLLPDLDADKSRSLSSLFSIFALCAAIGLPLAIEFHSLTTIWLSGLGVYLLIMYGLKPVFESYTIHRGASHSLLSVIMFTLIAVNISLYLDKALSFALLCGVMVTLGMLTHLILDECYAVDINNNELKASFGSALKPVAISAPLASTFQLGVVLLSGYFLLPHYENIPEVIQHWQNRLANLPLLPDMNTLKQFSPMSSAVQ
ncbi:metal-dependent hydrolase [Pseudoalteromonas sp. OOF1S-7]|uniref:metal-dependent hydrolase n=1 Tax=Pseudoalteromonas sp. OOF1S-7 TaxID=2917757 RepID=UPI001EF61075|nr:metal-dependent hydrolase [Pseudoalteromonas sp. OOF1S-7]